MLGFFFFFDCIFVDCSPFFPSRLLFVIQPDGWRKDSRRPDKRIGGTSNPLCPIQAPQCCQEKFATSSPFSPHTSNQSCALHDVFVERTTVHKRGRLRDQTAREMLTSEQSYAATLEEMVSVCGMKKPKQCTTAKTNTRPQHTCLGHFWDTAVRGTTESSSRHSRKDHFQKGNQHHLWECRRDHHNQPCLPL